MKPRTFIIIARIGTGIIIVAGLILLILTIIYGKQFVNYPQYNLGKPSTNIIKGLIMITIGLISLIFFEIDYRRKGKGK